jgi:predicted nuclease of predicted toxin-antitoxin system
VKILVDLNISPHVVGLLRAAGFDAVRVGTDTLDPRASDEEVHPASHPHPTPR